LKQANETWGPVVFADGFAFFLCSRRKLNLPLSDYQALAPAFIKPALRFA
jgi:hypothetical protein